MWDDATVEYVKDQWQAGKSASVIAIVLSERLSKTVTRNSVIGKVHRLGLMRNPVRPVERKVRPPRPTQQYKAKSARNRPVALSENARLAPTPADLAALAEMAARDPVARITSILDLEAHHCRWPVGDPKLPGFGWCGDTKIPGLSYCAPCAARAYKVPTVSVLLATVSKPRETVSA